MKFTLNLADELVRKLKLRAVIEHRTVHDLAAELLRQGLGRMPEASPQPATADSMVEITPEGLPIFKCPQNGPTNRMSAKKLLQLEQAAQTEADLSNAGLGV